MKKLSLAMMIHIMFVVGVEREDEEIIISDDPYNVCGGGGA